MSRFLGLFLVVLSLAGSALADGTDPGKADVADVAKRLAKIFESAGRYEVKTSTLPGMLQAYVAKRYQPSDVALRRYVKDATRVGVNDNTLATLTPQAAFAGIVSYAAELRPETKDDAQFETYARDLVTRALKAGARFGYDGSAQSRCAAPTAELLVLDTQAQLVYAVDLQPCRE
ncbi:MAG: hypothetical protein HY075_13250 [Deltaproteobacteria bacterium]|nr:hypothetical protein [Deltaproteobacteria bacterium]